MIQETSLFCALYSSYRDRSQQWELWYQNLVDGREVVIYWVRDEFRWSNTMIVLNESISYIVRDIFALVDVDMLRQVVLRARSRVWQWFIRFFIHENSGSLNSWIWNKWQDYQTHIRHGNTHLKPSFLDLIHNYLANHLVIHISLVIDWIFSNRFIKNRVFNGRVIREK